MRGRRRNRDQMNRGCGADAGASVEADAEGGMIVAGKSICGQPSASAAHSVITWCRRDGSPRTTASTSGTGRSSIMAAWRAGFRPDLQSLALGRVLADHPCEVREYKKRKYSREESVERARARIGEDLYHPAFNDCEHFVTWCITGKTRSTQVDLLFGLTGGVWGLLLSRSGPVSFTAGYAAIPRDRSNRLWVCRQ